MTREKFMEAIKEAKSHSHFKTSVFIKDVLCGGYCESYDHAIDHIFSVYATEEIEVFHKTLKAIY